MKRFCADDSADSRVKVGHRQASQPENAQSNDWAFLLGLFKRVLIKTKISVLEFKASLITVKKEKRDESQAEELDL